MEKKDRNLILLVFLVVFVGLSIDVVVGLNIWPMPKSVSYYRGGGGGRKTLYLSKDFQLNTFGSKYKDESNILKDGVSRILDVIEASHVIDESTSSSPHSSLIKGFHVVINSPYDELQYGIDESYKLSIPSSGNPIFAHLEAQTVYGALHGLQNILHWHIVDSQSFPLEIPSYPNLWNGAYTYSERYTMSDAAEIVDYARRRGINVLAEIDVPGHALSWGNGYPSLWPSPTCQQPLDVSNEFTFKVIDGILSDFSKVFKFKFVHLGGDEVNTSCWRTTPHVKKWLLKHRLNETEAYQYFVLQAQKIALSHGYEIVNWEETFNNFGSKLNRKTIVHNWLGGDVAPRVVASGLRCIASNQENWYLDHLNTTWKQFYMNEPLTNITNPKQQKLVIGGEVCMWGEGIDGSDIEQTIWPRAAAAAERLWTPYDKLAKDPREVTQRLARFRCLLNQRGVAAAPLAGPGRVAPGDPGSCFKQ